MSWRLVMAVGCVIGLAACGAAEAEAPATARDLQMTCARASAQLQGECASYAEKASALDVAIAESRPAEEVNRASAAADAAVAERVAA
jgi:hypothetical protein